MINPTVQEKLEDNREHYIELSKGFLDRLKDLKSGGPYLLQDEVEKSYRDSIKSLIINEICRDLALDYETVLSTLEEINLEEYLG